MAVLDSTTKTLVPKAKGGKTKNQAQAAERLKRAQQASGLLKHLSDPTRLQIILMLSEGERHVGSLCGDLTQSQPAVSHHLALLRHGAIVASRRDGKNNIYTLTATGVALAMVVKEMV